MKHYDTFITVLHTELYKLYHRAYSLEREREREREIDWDTERERDIEGERKRVR